MPVMCPTGGGRRGFFLSNQEICLFSFSSSERGRRVKGGGGGRDKRCVCSVPQADTSLLSPAQKNHMPRVYEGSKGELDEVQVCERG